MTDQIYVQLLLVFATLVSPSMSQQAAPAVNLTAITWDHAVNTQELLTKALEGTVEFIEADIVLGSLKDDETRAQQPVMGHPPATTSDITLESFLNQVLEHNRLHPLARKGVKLDFKSIEVWRGSEQMLQTLWPQMDYPVWLNADIIAGPHENTATVPVNASAFLAGAQRLPRAVLSIGWTTLWSKDHREGNYTTEQVEGMLAAIEASNLTHADHEITFPVRAGIAANSFDAMHVLLNRTAETNPCTLTIWSSAGDYVDVDALRRLIFSVGVDRVYVDVPEELAARLDLGNASGGGAAAGLVQFGVATVCMVLVSLLFG